MEIGFFRLENLDFLLPTGAELFAKRRKRSEKWIVDETTAATRSPSGVPFQTSGAGYDSDIGIQPVILFFSI